MQEIKEDDVIYSIVVNELDIPEGTKWYGAESEPMQACSWLWHQDKVFMAHHHLYNPRQITATQEALVVLKGKLRCTVTTKTKPVSFTLHPGDMVIHYRGGHGYKVLEDGTKAYEIKLGPSPSVMPMGNDKEYL